jgi:hypothetical protein
MAPSSAGNSRDAGNLYTRAPEALTGTLSSRTDVFALGVTVALAVSAVVPFQGGVGNPCRPMAYWTQALAGQTREGLLADARARLVSHAGELGAGLAAVLDGCCQVEAKDRMDAGEVVGRLEALGPGAVSRLPRLAGLEDVAAFLTALEDRALTVAVLRLGLSQLRSLVLGTPRDGRAPLLCAVPALVRVMRAHTGDAVVQQLCIAVLGTVATHASDAAAPLLLSAVKDVLTAAATHVGSAAVQAEVCWWVGNVTCGKPSTDAPLMVCCPAIQAALRDHFGDVEVQVNGLIALSNLAHAVGNKGPLLAYADVVRPALATHAGVAGVQEAGLAFLVNLAVAADNKGPLLAYADVVRPAMTAHAGVAGVQEEGLRFLCNLAAAADNKAPLLAYAEVVRPALAAHVSVASVQERGLGFLCNIAVAADNKAPLLAYADVVRPALAAHPADAGVVRSALGFTLNLTANTANRAALAADADLVAAVTAAAATHDTPDNRAARDRLTGSRCCVM